ncbi:MAG: hypothetical protein AAF902_19265 [Chloroflexota bacterium]
MADYSNVESGELQRKVKNWNMIQTIALVLFSLGFLGWLLIDSWRSNSMIFILLFGFISTFILFVGQGPRAMAAELEGRKSKS